MSELSDEKLIEIGRAVVKELSSGDSPRGWPRVLVFELFDHKRRLHISEFGQRLLYSEVCRDELTVSEVKFPNGPFPI